MKHILYWFSKIFYYCFTAFFIFLFVFSILSFCEYNLGWDIPFVEIDSKKNTLSIIFPFIDLTLSFPPNAIVILPLAIFAFYSFYFYMMYKFFKVFISKPLFEEKAINSLRYFFYLNLIILIVAFIAIIIETIYRGYFKMDESLGFIFIHGFVTIITYLYVDMAKKGAVLQSENDLTI